MADYLRTHFSRDNWRLTLARLGIIVTFALTPLWRRFPGASPPFSATYFIGFVLTIPILWSIIWWILAGFPGLRAFSHSKTRVIWSVALLALAGWAVLSQSWAFIRADEPGVAISAALQLLIAAAFALVVACAAPSPRTIVIALLFVLVWNAVIAGLQVTAQSSIGLQWLGERTLNPALSGVGVIEVDGVRWLRPYSLLPHPNMLAGILVVTLLVCVAWITANQRKTRWIGTLVFFIGLWMLLLTFSRAAWGGFAVGAFVLLPLMLRHRLRQSAIRRHVFITLILTIMLGITFVLMYRPFLSARAGIGEESIELRSISDRVVFNEIALTAITENRVFGVGAGNFPWYASYYLFHNTDYDLRGDNVHNIMLSAWAELGIVGLTLFIVAQIAGIEAALQRIKNTNDERAVFLAGFIALIAIGILDHYTWTILHFQTLWWGLIAAAMSHTVINDATPTPSPD